MPCICFRGPRSGRWPGPFVHRPKRLKERDISAEGIVVRGTKKKFKDTGRFDHIAFAGTDIDGVRKKLKTKKVKFREQTIPRTGGQQIFLYDPDGVGVEINFPPPSTN